MKRRSLVRSLAGRFLARAAVALAALVPYASAIAVQPLRTPISSRRTSLRLATLAVLPVLVCAAVQWIAGRDTAAAEVVGLALLVLCAFVVSGVQRRIVAAGLSIGLLILVSLAAYAAYADMFRWRPVSETEAPLLQRSPFGSVRLDGRPGFAISGYRKWSLQNAGDQPTVVTVDLAELEGHRTGAWRTSNDGLRQRPGPARTEATTILQFDGPSQFAFQSAATSDALSGRTFTASLWLRAEAPPESSCGVIALGENGAASVSETRVCLHADWSRYDVTWTAPEESRTHLIDVILTGFTGEIEASDAQLTEVTADGRQPVGPMAPTGVTLRVSWDVPFPWSPTPSRQRFSTVLPDAGTQRVQVVLPSNLPAGTEVWTTLHVADGLRVRVGRTSWEGGTLVPLYSIDRMRLWFGHPNVLGHVAAALGVAGIVSARGLLTVPITMLALVLIALTGSRTAFFALLFALVVQVLLSDSVRRRVATWLPRWPTVAALLAILIVGGFVAGTWFGSEWNARAGLRITELSRAAINERIAIWSHAVDLIGQAPWLGSGTSFADSWSAAKPQANEVTHAHNGLLDVASRYGVPAALSLLFALGVLAWMAGRQRLSATAIVLGAFAILNTSDATYAVPAVAVPLAYALLQHTGANPGPDDRRGAPLAHAPQGPGYPGPP